MSYDDAVNKSVKLHPPDREALDAVVEESDEWGNDSAAIRGLIRQAADGETAATTDGGHDRETYHPDTDRLDTVYSAALRLVDHSHVLPDDDCATVARLVSNDGDNPWSPREDAVRRCLRSLRPGYVYVDHRATSVRHTRDTETTIYRLKPETAVSESWKWHRKNVRERERRREEKRVERLVSPADD